MPGGYQSQGVDEGLAVLGKSAAFGAFLIANTLAFGLSMTSILVHFIASLRSDGLSRNRAVLSSFIYTYLAITKKWSSVIAAVVSDFLCTLQGRMVEIYAREASGKTTLALHIIKEAQKFGGVY